MEKGREEDKDDAKKGDEENGEEEEDTGKKDRRKGEDVPLHGIIHLEALTRIMPAPTVRYIKLTGRTYRRIR